MKLYINIDTGEVLTYQEMIQQWRKDYDGEDPTNILTWCEQYKEIK